MVHPDGSRFGAQARLRRTQVGYKKTTPGGLPPARAPPATRRLRAPTAAPFATASSRPNIAGPCKPPPEARRRIVRTTGAGYSSAGREEDVLQLRVVVEGVRPQLPPDARLLEAAKRGG